MHHSTGKPINQRENAGLSPAGFTVATREEHKVACLGSWSNRRRSDPSGLVPVVAIPDESFQSRLAGLHHPARNILASVAKLVWRTRPVFRFTHLLPTLSKSSLISPVLPSADGVGQPDRFAAPGSLRKILLVPSGCLPE